MDPLTMAMMLSSIAEGAKNIGAGAAKFDRLTAEERNRKKQLERQRAMGELGAGEAERQRIQSQFQQPVAAAMRQALNEQAQGSMIESIGQGSSFRGQQALAEAGAKAGITAQQKAEQEFQSLDELARARQLNELQALKTQQQQNLAAAGQMLGGAVQTAADVKAAPSAAEHRKAMEAATVKALKNEAAKEAKEAVVNKADKNAPEGYVEELSSLTGNTTDTKPDPNRTNVNMFEGEEEVFNTDPAVDAAIESLQGVEFEPLADTGLVETLQAPSWAGGEQQVVKDAAGNVTRIIITTDDGKVYDTDVTDGTTKIDLAAAINDYESLKKKIEAENK